MLKLFYLLNQIKQTIKEIEPDAEIILFGSRAGMKKQRTQTGIY